MISCDARQSNLKSPHSSEKRSERFWGRLALNLKIRRVSDDVYKYDSRNAFSAHWTVDKPGVIDVGQALRAYFERAAAWEEVRAYLDCVFTLENPNAQASAGDGFLKGR